MATERQTATLEVLACIAFKQPISQAEIDQLFDAAECCPTAFAVLERLRGREATSASSCRDIQNNGTMGAGKPKNSEGWDSG